MHALPALRHWLVLSMLTALMLIGGGNRALAATGGVLPVPALDARVIDQTGTLSADDRTRLQTRLETLEKQRGSQVVVLMVSTTKPEDIAAYAWRVADAWKIGRRDVGDGVLVVVALNDRAMRIEVARALEGAIPDLEARRIIDQEMGPAFREGRFAQGLERAVARIDARIGGENLPAPAPSSAGAQGGSTFDDIGLFMLIGVPVLGAVLSSVVGRGVAAAITATGAGALTWWFTQNLLFAGGAAMVAAVVVASMGGGGRGGGGRGGGPWGGLPPGGWGGGGRGGRSSGGGFSSGRGGSFGGGGASGRW